MEQAKSQEESAPLKPEQPGRQPEPETPSGEISPAQSPSEPEGEKAEPQGTESQGQEEPAQEPKAAVKPVRRKPAAKKKPVAKDDTDVLGGSEKSAGNNPQWYVIHTLSGQENKVKENLFWAFGYNTLAIPLGMGILYPFFAQVVSPELAALLMATSSLSVTLNTLRMRGFVPAIRRRGQPVTLQAIPVAPQMSH